MEWRYAVRLLCAGLVAILVSWALSIPESGAVMVVFFSMLMVQSTLGGTLSLVKPMIGWSLLGVGVGVFAVVAFEPVLQKMPEAIWFLLGAMTLYGAIVLPFSAIARLSFITALLIIASGSQVNAPEFHALMRAGYVGLGLIISISISYLVFPQRAATAIAKRSQEVVDRAGKIVKMVRRAILYPKAPWDPQLCREMTRELRDEVSQASDMERLLQFEGKSTTRSFGQVLWLSQKRMINYLFGLIQITDEVRGNPLLLETSKEVTALLDMLEEGLASWTAELYHSLDQVFIPDVDSVVTSIKSKIDQHAQREFSIDVWDNYFSLIHTLRVFLSDFSEFIAEMHDSE